MGYGGARVEKPVPGELSVGSSQPLVHFPTGSDPLPVPCRAASLGT